MWAAQTPGLRRTAYETALEGKENKIRAEPERVRKVNSWENDQICVVNQIFKRQIGMHLGEIWGAQMVWKVAIENTEHKCIQDTATTKSFICH